MAVDLTGFIWFRETNTTPVYIYNPITGTKRHISSSEGTLLRAANNGAQYPVVNTTKAVVSGIPNA